MQLNYKEHLFNRLDYFTYRSLKDLAPDLKYQHNWHLDMIYHKLMRVMQGDLKRLIINMPPRYMKSLCVSVAWPAWILGRDPTKKIIAASYSQSISNKHSQDCRLIVSSDWFKSAFPQTKIARGENLKAKFVTTARGFRMATSVGGSITGEGADILILDDPQNPSKINSSKYRNNIIEWFEQTFVSRLNNKRDGSIIIVMQRLHENDLCGYLLSNKPDQWEILKIPAIFEEEMLYSGDYQMIAEKGAVLHETRENLDTLMRLKRELGEFNFQAQYNQNPISINGSMIDKKWLRYFKIENKPRFLKIIQSFDCAIKAKDEHDYTVGITIGINEEGFYLIDLIRKKMEFPELQEAAKNFALKWKPNLILIEDKASGQSLIQTLKKLIITPIIPVKPKNDKVSRFAKHTPKFEAGKIFIPESSWWKDEFLKEIMHFPKSCHDDQVDALSQALEYLDSNKLLQVRAL